MTAIHIKERRGRFRHGNTQERSPCDNGDTDDAALSQGAPWIAGDHQKLGTAKEGFFPRAFRSSKALVDV